jgi:LacI family transcriptional regulator
MNNLNNKSKERKQPVTMYEIARLAGVSQSTVSRVLNGKIPVAPEKQAAVLAVMEQLNYRPNLAAQGLVSGRTSSIGILTRHLGSPFYGEMLRGIAQGLQGSSYHPVIGLGGVLPFEDENAMEMLRARQCDGFILALRKSLDDDYVRELAEEFPVVVLGRLIEGLESQCVLIDDRGGAYMATSYLIEKGHTQIAHIQGPLDVADSHERREGFIQAHIDHGLEVDPNLITNGDFTEEAGVQGIEILLSQRKQHPFTAVFVADDQCAMGVRLGLFHKGIDVPHDISLVGFDDLPSSQYMTPPLTTIRQPVTYMGTAAAQAVLAMLHGETYMFPKFPLELVARQSVALRR